MSTPPRVTPRSLAAAERVLRNALEFRYPVDAVLAREMRTDRSLQSAERRLVGEAVFGALRRLRTFGAIGGDSPRQLIATAVARHPTLGPTVLAPLLDPAAREQAERIAAAPAPSEPPALACDLPDWLYDRLAARLGAEETREAAAALARPAPLDLRINPARISRDEALARLRRDGFRAEAGALSPLAIRVLGRPSVREHPFYRSGALEIQDEGSQLVALLVGARPREMVADYCAGAGGKTLVLGARMESNGRLYAFDTEAGRLERLRPRLKRSGLSNVMPVVISPGGGDRVRKLAGKLDRVLVDAPCTGVGTVRRNPDLKWKHRPEDVRELATKQRGILTAAGRLVRPGGRLVYATCSWLREENEAVVESFLAEHDEFTLRDPRRDLAATGSVIAPRDHEAGSAEFERFLQLWPHRHGTDGFFMAALERRG